MPYDIKTTVSLSTEDLIKALEEGSFTGLKVERIDWKYRNAMTDAGRGNPTYERVVAGAVIEFRT